jgi:AmmeMemoRadiSam system protein B
LTRAKAVVVPHAGYVYSGKTAGEVIRKVQIPEVCLLLGPNHWGVGLPFALVNEGSWETPLGSVPIERDFASGLLAACHDLAVDSQAHEREHSLEVEVPLLQYRNPEVKIVPLLIGTLDLERTRRVALSLARFLKTRSGFLIVASTDMNHYENDEVTRKKDRYALQAIEALDAEGLQKVVAAHHITMCGYVPVYLTLLLVKALGAKRATLVDYRTSAEASGDYERVVGYAGFIIE